LTLVVEKLLVTTSHVWHFSDPADDNWLDTGDLDRYVPGGSGANPDQ
jgi:hypothetical protein